MSDGYWFSDKPLRPDEQGPADDDGLATAVKWLVICFFFFGVWMALR